MDIYKVTVDLTEVQYIIRPFYFANGAIQDAPTDGKVYGRQNGIWVDINFPFTQTFINSILSDDSGNPILDDNNNLILTI